MRIMDRLSAPGGLVWLTSLWQELGGLYPERERVEPALRYSFEPVGGPWQVAILQLPEPTAARECWFAALAWRPAQPGWLGFVAHAPEARYLVAERTTDGAPLLAEWFEDGTRQEHTALATSDKQIFVDVLRLQLA